MGVFAKTDMASGTVLVVESPLMYKSQQAAGFSVPGVSIMHTNVIKALQLYSGEMDVLSDTKVCHFCSFLSLVCGVQHHAQQRGQGFAAISDEMDVLPDTKVCRFCSFLSLIDLCSTVVVLVGS